MTRNPIINALCAIAYIGAVVSIIFYGPIFLHLPQNDSEVSIFFPIGMLSLFVLSAAVMGYLFLYQPILMVLAEEKKEGTKLFLQTTAAFAVGALVFVAAGLFLTGSFA